MHEIYRPSKAEENVTKVREFHLHTHKSQQQVIRHTHDR